MTNYQFGLISPSNYWMLENMWQNQQRFMPYYGGYAPTFTGGIPYGTTPTQQQTTTKAQPQLTDAQKIELIDKKIEEALNLKKQTEDIVQVQVYGQQLDTTKKAYDEKNQYLAEDGNNDGDISAWSKAKNFGKGCLNLVTSMFCDEKGKLSGEQILSTFATGGLLFAIGALAPVTVPFMVGIGAAIGVGTLAHGIIKSNTAKTDLEAERAWQNLGTGTATTILSLVGAKSMGGKDASIFKPFTNLKHGFQTALNRQKAAGGFSALAEKQWSVLKNDVKLLTDRAWHTISGKSFNQKNYEQAMATIESKINDPNVSDDILNDWKTLKDLYTKTYEATSKNQAKRVDKNLNKFIKTLKKRLTNGTNVDDFNATKAILEMCENSAPKLANRMNQLYPVTNPADDFQATISALDSKITNPSTSAFEKSILSDTKAALEMMNKAGKVDDHKFAMDELNNLLSKVCDQMKIELNNPTINNDKITALMKLHSETAAQISKADAIINARNQNLLRLKNIIETSTNATEKAKAISDLNEYGLIVDDVAAYVNKTTPKVGFFKRQWNGIKESFKTGKQIACDGLKIATKPEGIATMSLIDLGTTPNTWMTSGVTKIENPDIIQTLKTNDEYIRQLQQMRHQISCGANVDVSKLA